MSLSLRDDEVHVWTASRDAPAGVVEVARGLLDAEERRRAGRFVNPADRTRFAVSRGLLRTILGHYLDHPPARIAFVGNMHGKPGLDPAMGLDPALRFNVSHSGGLVLYAIARGRELGVDVEEVRPRSGSLAIAERFFSPGEVEALRRLPEERRQLAFFHAWTRKEAYIKARGKGLALPLDEFEVSVDPSEPARLVSTRPDPEEAARWTLVEVPTEPDYVAALCAEGGGWSLRRGWWPVDGREPGPELGPPAVGIGGG